MKTENRWKKIVHNCKVLKKLLHSPKAKKKNLTRQNCPTPPLSKIKWFIPYFILNSRNISKGCSRCHSMRPHEGRSACKSGYITGSRGDVFVVTTSKPVENIWNNGLFWSHWRSRYSFVTHSVYRKPRDWGLARSAYSIKYFVPRSPFGHPSGDVPCASEDMACGYWFSKWRTTKSIWVR